MRELYEADFHKPGIYGSGRVWANAWNVRRAPSRGGRGRRAAVDFAVCFGCDGIYLVFFMMIFSNSCTRPLAARGVDLVKGLWSGFYLLIGSGVF